jgi:3-oxoacyl-[acyl-carrier-protein] synthase II
LVAGQVGELLGRKGLLGMEPATRLALCAVHAALGGKSRQSRAPEGPDSRTAVVVSSNLGNVATVVRTVDTVRTDSWRHVSPLDAPNASSNVIASTIAIWFQLGGPNLMICSGAASGLDAVAAGMSLLFSGRADRVVVVGAEPDDDVAQGLHRSRRSAAARRALRAGAGCVVLEATDRAGAAILRLVIDPETVSSAAPASPVLVGLSEAWGDLYGATGVIALASAAALLAGGQFAGPCRVGCGDDADGWRFASVAPSSGSRPCGMT